MPIGEDGEPSYYVDDSENGTLRAGHGSSAERGIVPATAATLLGLHGGGGGQTHDDNLVAPPVSATLQAKRGKGGGGLGPEETLLAVNLRAPQIATTLSAGSHPNSAIPGHKQEDDVNLVPTGDGLAQPTPALMRGGQGSGDVDFEQFVPVAETLRSHPRPGSTSPGAWALQPDDHGDTPGALRGVAVDHSPTLGTNSAITVRGVRVRHATGVRRLTPIECERLQGFPDGWTIVPGVKCPDARRYAAMGNAVTVNVAEWIGRRIAAADAAWRLAEGD